VRSIDLVSFSLSLSHSLSVSFSSPTPFFLPPPAIPLQSSSHIHTPLQGRLTGSFSFTVRSIPLEQLSCQTPPQFTGASQRRFGLEPMACFPQQGAAQPDGTLRVHCSMWALECGSVSDLKIDTLTNSL
jgi:hypothetical protein